MINPFVFAAKVVVALGFILALTIFDVKLTAQLTNLERTIIAYHGDIGE
jgi:hypothetical protein